MAASQTFELMLAGADAPHECVAWVPDGQGGRAAEHRFAWRSDSTALALDLGALAQAVTAGHAPADDLHVRFGRSLYDAALGGAVGELWRSRRQAAGRTPLRLVLRIDPASARPLLNLPWEYLHDGRDFLALSWRTPLSRLPWGIDAAPLGALDEPLRLLVQIAAPHGLGQNEVLNSAREEDLLLEALGPARRAGRVEIEFTPNGTLEALEAGLREFNPHVLHFIGHAFFDQEQDRGSLLMESTGDHKRYEVLNHKFAKTIERMGQSLRLVFLAACQTAVAPRGEGFADLGLYLLAAGIPAVVAMQFSVLNRSAIALGAAFYQALADNDALDDAMTEARDAMRSASPNSVDFAVPVLFLSDPACLQVNIAAVSAARPQVAIDISGLIAAQQFVGRTAELRELQTHLDPQHGNWRAAIVHGLGGMGKTALAARLAERMISRFDGIVALRATPTTRAQDVLDQLIDFLRFNNSHFNLVTIAELAHTKNQALPIQAKAGVLASILRILKLFVIFDNFESVLPESSIISWGAPTIVPDTVDKSTYIGSDPDLAALIARLVGSVAGPSRFLFTSRVDFQPVEPGRIDAAIGRIALAEMQFRDAVYLMETLPPLDALPVAVPDPILPGAASAAPLPAAAAPALAAISMRDLYTRLGGHPYTLTLFASHARHSSVAAVLTNLGGLRKELLDFTLLGRAVAKLSARAALLLRRAAVYEEPVPAEGLAWLLGDERDAMPAVDDELAALLGWGLLARPPGSRDYTSHTLVRDWARTQWADDERLALLRRAAQYWVGIDCEITSLQSKLNARRYLFAAGDYEAADRVVKSMIPYLMSGGQIELANQLLSESAYTIRTKKSLALGNLAHMSSEMANNSTSLQYYEQVLREFEELGDKRSTAVTLHALGSIHQAQGAYEQAQAYFQQSLEIEQALEDRQSAAKTLYQLGSLHQEQGEYDKAQGLYEQSLKIGQDLEDQQSIAQTLQAFGNLYYLQDKYTEARECYQQSLCIKNALDDHQGAAQTLHALGNLHQIHGEYTLARERYQQALEIAQSLGDQAGAAQTLHALGNLHQIHGEYTLARERYQQALEIAQSLGDHVGVATSLHQLGMLNYLQGEYRLARERYQQALMIAQSLGDQAGVATSLHQLGMLHQAQGEYGAARARYQQALTIKQALGDQAGVGSSLHQLGNLHYLQGEYGAARARYQESLELAQALGDQAGVATSLHQLGMLHQAQGEYGAARARYQQSLTILQALGDQVGVARSLGQLGTLHYLQGEYAAAQERYQQALEIAQSLGDQVGVATSLHQLGMLNYLQGEYRLARERYQQALMIAQSLGDQAGVATSLHQLGMLHQAQGEYGAARARYQESLELAQALGDQAGVARSLHQLGMLHELQGEYGAARARYQESLELAQALGDQAGVARSLHQLGMLEEQEGQPARAVVLLAQAYMLFTQLGMPARTQARRDLQRLCSAMGQAAFDAALAAARLPALPLDTADDADAASADDGMTVAQAIELVVNNSAAVLTSAPEHQAEWLETLQQWQAGAQAQGLDEFATFCGLLRELVAGADAAGLAARVPEPMRAAWEELLGSLGGAALPGATPAA